VRFPADLAAARALAAVTPAGPVPPANSRQAAEVRVLTLYVRGLNGGCGSRGGEVVTELPPIVWTSDTTGTVAGVAFTAQMGADGTWQVQLIAC
jgi:hypothetical protein